MTGTHTNTHRHTHTHTLTVPDIAAETSTSPWSKLYDESGNPYYYNSEVRFTCSRKFEVQCVFVSFFF